MTLVTVKVEAMPGADCTDIIREMCQLSSRIGIGVQSRLNGVETCAMPFCDVSALCRAWHEEMQSDRKYKFVSGRPHQLAAVGKSGSEPK